MSVSSINLNISGFNQVTAPVAKTKISISKTLQGFLNDTISGKVQWQRQSQKEAGQYKDQFTASNNGINLKLSAGHPISDGQGIPNRLIDWEAELTTEGKAARVIDGKSLILPKLVNDTTPLTVQTLPKLFKKAYDSVSSSFGGFAPMIQQLTEKLRMREPDIDSSYSFIKPSLAYPSFGSGSVMQISDKTQNLKIEVTRFAGESQVTIRHGAKTSKLRKMALENPVLFSAVDNLVKEANFQRTNNPNMGIEN